MKTEKKSKSSILLGQKIKYLRKIRHWSIEVLSFETGINRNYLSDLENGRRNPTLKILEKIAFAFRISIKELFNFDK